MQSRVSLKIGGPCAMLGAAGIFFGNFLHPFLPDDREGMLRLIASEPMWTVFHLPTMFFALAILLALAAISDSIIQGVAASLARMGRICAQAGLPVMLVGVAIDGFAFKTLADAWSRAAEGERTMLLHAAEAIILAETGILHIWVTFFLGMTFILYGLAVAFSVAYPRFVGWLGIAGGAGCLVSGVAGFLRLPLVIPFPVFGTVVLAWTFIMGALMIRRARSLAIAPVSG